MPRYSETGLVGIVGGVNVSLVKQINLINTVAQLCQWGFPKNYAITRHNWEALIRATAALLCCCCYFCFCCFMLLFCAASAARWCKSPVMSDSLQARSVNHEKNTQFVQKTLIFIYHYFFYRSMHYAKCLNYDSLQIVLEKESQDLKVPV